MKNILILSSPNSRGIHQYARHLSTTLPDSTIVYPHVSRHLWIFWELVAVPLIILKNRQAHFYLCNSRASPLVLLFPRITCTLVIHDFIDNITLKPPFCTLRNLFSARRIYHTLLFLIAHRVSTSIISNSTYTFAEANRILGTDTPNRIVEPRTSFFYSLSSRSLDYPTYTCTPLNKTVLIVTGKSKNKSFERYLLLFLSQLHVFARYKVTINLIGIDEAKLSPRSLAIIDDLRRYVAITFCKSMPEESLIDYYLNASLFISLSSSEGFGIPFTDALTFSIPSIYTLIPSYVNQVKALRHSPPPLYALPNSDQFLVHASEPQLTSFISAAFSQYPPNPNARIRQYLHVSNQHSGLLS